MYIKIISQLVGLNFRVYLGCPTATCQSLYNRALKIMALSLMADKKQLGYRKNVWLEELMDITIQGIDFADQETAWKASIWLTLALSERNKA